MTQIYDNIQPPVKCIGRPRTESTFDKLSPGQCFFVPMPEGSDAAKEIARVRGQAARWRKADADRANHRFLVAVGDIPNDPMGAKGVGVWRTA